MESKNFYKWRDPKVHNDNWKNYTFNFCITDTISNGSRAMMLYVVHTTTHSPLIHHSSVSSKWWERSYKTRGLENLAFHSTRKDSVYCIL